MDDRPSGWYDDPDEPSRLRYWDGQSWTERIHEKAPMPAPQPARPPVTRLRPSREDTSEQGTDGGATDANGDRGDGRENGHTLGASDSPRPWSATGRTAPTDSGGRRRTSEPADARRAGYLRRLIGVVVDLLVVFVLYVVVLAVAAPFLGDTLAVSQAYVETFWQAVDQGRQPPEPPANVAALTTTLTLILAGMLVLYDLVLLRQFGATLGCLLTGIRVRDAEGGDAPTPGRLILRAILKYAVFVFSASPLTSLIGYVFTVVNIAWPLADKERRTLHDKWTRTEVVRRR